MPLLTRPAAIWRTGVALALIVVATAAAAPAMAQTISDSIALSFGSFVAGSGGSVTVSANNFRTASGGVSLINNRPGAASQSTVTGTAGSTYSIHLPANGIVFLSDGKANTMAVNDFVSIPISTSGSTGLLLTGSQTIRIGAKLSVSNNQPPGDYVGSFNVTVDYP